MDMLVMLKILVCAVLIIVPLTLIFTKVFKDKKNGQELTQEQKADIQEITLVTINKILQVAQIKDEENLIDFCVEETLRRLNEVDITIFSREAIEVMVRFAISQSKKIIDTRD